MDSLAEVTREQFQSVLTDAAVRTFQIIQGAIGAGVAMFFTAVLFVSQQSPALPDAEAVGPVNLLSLVHAFVAAAAYAAANFFYTTAFKEDKLKEGVAKTLYDQQRMPITDPAEKCLAAIRTATIVRLALWEAPALFGLVVCMIASTNGLLREYSMYWLNLMTGLIFIGLVVITFPNKEKLENIFATYISVRS
jgi:hypothetical protein